MRMRLRTEPGWTERAKPDFTKAAFAEFLKQLIRADSAADLARTLPGFRRCRILGWDERVHGEIFVIVEGKAGL